MIQVRPAKDGQLAPWSISRYFNRVRDQISRSSYRQVAGLVEQAEPLEAEWLSLVSYVYVFIWIVNKAVFYKSYALTINYLFLVYSYRVDSYYLLSVHKMFFTTSDIFINVFLINARHFCTTLDMLTMNRLKCLSKPSWNQYKWPAVCCWMNVRQI